MKDLLSHEADDEPHRAWKEKILQPPRRARPSNCFHPLAWRNPNLTCAYHKWRGASMNSLKQKLKEMLSSTEYDTIVPMIKIRRQSYPFLIKIC